MGCFQSTESIDFDTIQPAVLRTAGGTATYSGTTERGKCQVSFNSSCITCLYFYLLRSSYFFLLKTLGDAELALTDDCFYSQVIGTGCCGDQGLIRIPVLSVKDIRQQACKTKPNFTCIVII